MTDEDEPILGIKIKKKGHVPKATDLLPLAERKKKNMIRANMLKVIFDDSEKAK